MVKIYMSIFSTIGNANIIIYDHYVVAKIFTARHAQKAGTVPSGEVGNTDGAGNGRTQQWVEWWWWRYLCWH